MSTRAALSVVAALAAGCGFALRTWDVAVAFETVAIQADRSADLDRELAQALRSAGVRVVDTDADAVLVLADQRSDRRSAAVTSTGRAAEYELAIEVTFSVVGRDEELAAARQLRSERVARLDRDNIVGSSEEQALLATEMRNDLVGQMLRTLAAVGKR